MDTGTLIFIILGLILPCILLVLAFTFVYLKIRLPGIKLRDKFKNLGELVGKSCEEITSFVGCLPRKTLALCQGKKIMTWYKGTYQIELMFDSEDVCVAETNEAYI